MIVCIVRLSNISRRADRSELVTNPSQAPNLACRVEASAAISKYLVSFLLYTG